MIQSSFRHQISKTIIFPMNTKTLLHSFAVSLPLTAVLGCILSVYTTAHAAPSAGKQLIIPLRAGLVNHAVVTHPLLPFKASLLSDPETVPFTLPMQDTQSALAEVKTDVAPSLEDQRNFASAYQSAVRQRALVDYHAERNDRAVELVSGNRDNKEIALTFDDGPHGQVSIDLINALKTLDVPATFFVVGKQAIKYPSIVQLEVLDGNEVGNHTYDHVTLTKLPIEEAMYELDECDTVLRHIIGTAPRFFRPPGGDCDVDIVRAAAAHGYITTLWTDDPGDFNKPTVPVLLQRLTANLRPGGIILLHDGIPQTVQALPQFVSEARAQGYRFVTMSQLADGVSSKR